MRYFFFFYLFIFNAFAASLERAIDLQNRGENEASRKEFGKLIQENNISDFVMQEVEYRYAKLSFEELKKQYPDKDEVKKYIDQLVIPLLLHAKKLNGSPDVVYRISELESEIKIYLDLDPTILFTGEKFKSKKSNIIITQKIIHDSNINPIEEIKPKKTSNQDWFSSTKLLLAGEDLFARRLVLGAQLEGEFARFFNRKDRNIYQNDFTNITATLEGDYLLNYNSKNDHLYGSWQTNKKYMDYQAKFNRKSYSSSANYKLGYTKSFFKPGPSYIEYLVSHFDNVTSTYKYEAKEIKFIQFFESKISLGLSYKHYTYQDSSLSSKDIGLSASLLEWSFKDDFLLDSSMEIIFSASDSAMKLDNFIYKKWMDNFYFGIDANLYKSISKESDYKFLKGLFGVTLKFVY